MTKSTTNTFMEMARAEEIRDYATAEYRVLAKAPCESKLPVKMRRSFKDLSNEMVICDQRPTPPYEVKDKNTQFKKLFGAKNSLRDEFVLSWHMTHFDEVGIEYEIEEFVIDQKNKKVGRFTYTKRGETSKNWEEP